MSARCFKHADRHLSVLIEIYTNAVMIAPNIALRPLINNLMTKSKIIGDKSRTPPSGGISFLTGSSSGSYILPSTCPTTDYLSAGSQELKI